MPQATEELRKEWDGPDDYKALTYLKDRGFVVTPHWEFIPTQTVNDKDLSAITFMIQEWDYGGLADGCLFGVINNVN